MVEMQRCAKETRLTYAARSIHLHCVQNWMVTLGSAVDESVIPM